MWDPYEEPQYECEGCGVMMEEDTRVCSNSCYDAGML